MEVPIGRYVGYALARSSVGALPALLALPTKRALAGLSLGASRWSQAFPLALCGLAMVAVLLLTNGPCVVLPARVRRLFFPPRRAGARPLEVAAKEG